jgi:tRNA (mo5U34)-methyltransferase
MLYDALRSKGELFMESIVIPGGEPTALCPPGRYAKMRNVWYLPTDRCLEVWLEKAGFDDIEVVSSCVLTTSEEQRRTVLMPYESLEDYLDPGNSMLTVEGHPAPRRSIIRARKR